MRVILLSVLVLLVFVAAYLLFFPKVDDVPFVNESIVSDKPEVVVPEVLVNSSDAELYELAIAASNASICAAIVDEDLRSGCFSLTTNNNVSSVSYSVDDKSVFELAVERNDPSLCEYIVDERLLGECVLLLGSVPEPVPSVVIPENITLSDPEPEFQPPTDEELFQLAVKKNDAALCESIVSEKLKNQCLLIIG